MIIHRKPIALIAEDDQMQGLALSFALNHLGIDPRIVDSTRAFVAKLKEICPDICFVDLNVERPLIGLRLIQAIRGVIGSEPILIAVSGTSDSITLARAAEAGADDFIVKPIDRTILGAKVARYLGSERINAKESQFMVLDHDGPPATVSLGLELAEINETGVKVVGPALLAQDVTYGIESDVFYEIAGSRLMQVTVFSTWANEDGISFGAAASFDKKSTELLEKVRRWLVASH